MKNLIKTKISLLLFSLSFQSFAANPVSYKNCMETIRQINTGIAFDGSDFVFDVGETNFGDEKVRTVFVSGTNKNYNAPKKQEDGSYVQELIVRNNKMKIFWNDKKELVKIRSGGVGHFDDEFFAKYIEFDTKNDTCIPMSYYSGSSGSSDKTKSQEYFNTKLCYDLEKYLSVSDERKKCLTQYVPELMKILEKYHKDLTFPSGRYDKDTQVSVTVFGELGNCKTFKTLPLAQDFSLWEPPVPSVVVTPVTTEKD